MTLNPEAPQPNRLFQSSSLQAAKCANSMPTFSGNSGWSCNEGLVAAGVLVQANRIADWENRAKTR